MITANNKAAAFALTQTHKTDVGSPQAQASVLTTRIKEVTLQLLKYLEAKDFEAYKATVAKLGLRK